jgi:Zn-dependent protease with chaperone function
MNRLQFLLTRVYIKTAIGGSVKEVRTTELENGKKLEIIVYSRRGTLYLGQSTVFGTIIIEESLFSEYGDNVQQYVLVHEYAHSKQKSIYYLMPLMVLSFIYLIFYPIALTVFLFFFLSSDSAILLNLALGSILFAFSIIVFIGSSWYLEGRADFYATLQMGKDRFLAARQEIKSKYPNPGLMYRAISRLTHPPLGLLLEVYDYFHKPEE